MRKVFSRREDGSLKVLMYSDDPSLTRQEFREECDLALTLKRFCRTPEGRSALLKAQGFIDGSEFGDVSEIPDYRTAMNQVMKADKAFLRLPAAARKQFDNDAAKFLDFCKDPNNLDQLRIWGLAKPKNPVNPPVGGSSTPPVKG